MTCSDSLYALSCEKFYSTGLTNFIKQLSVEVSIVTTSKETYGIIFTALSKRRCQNIENDNKVNQGEVGGRPIKNVLGGL